MKKTAESNLWKWLRNGLKGTDGLHMCRIETSTMSGYPDIEACYKGRNFHIELKTTTGIRDIESLFYTGVSLEQELWARARAQAGGYCFLLIQVGKERFIKKNPYSKTESVLDFRRIESPVDVLNFTMLAVDLNTYDKPGISSRVIKGEWLRKVLVEKGVWCSADYDKHMTFFCGECLTEKTEEVCTLEVLCLAYHQYCFKTRFPYSEGRFVKWLEDRYGIREDPDYMFVVDVNVINRDIPAA